MTTLSIFRPGCHTASSGLALDFSEADLSAAARAYDPAKHEAPLVVGHPKTDDPAYGWVKSLSFEEGELRALPHQVDPAFQDMVAAGRFKKISASFYTPKAPGNPVPGTYYLRHVGFLGAQPPAVKGLRDASFATGDEAGVVTFGDFGDRVEAGLWRRLREWVIGKFGLEEADKALPGWDIDQLKTLADRPDEDPASAPNAAYAEEERMKEEDLKRRETELATRQAELDRKDAEFAERMKSLETRDRATRTVELTTFCEGLVSGGQLPPAQKEGLVAFMAALDPEASLEFGEGEGRKTEPSLAWFKSFLTALPKALDFSERGKSDSPVTADFSAAPGCTVDAAGLELHAKALAYQKANPDTSYLAAVKAVS